MVKSQVEQILCQKGATGDWVIRKTETSKGELALALALGFILLAISLAVNFLVQWLKASARRRAYV